MNSIGSLFDDLTIVNIKGWFAEQICIDSEVPQEVYDAKKKAIKLNEQRYALIHEINQRLGEKDFKVVKSSEDK